MMRRRRSGVPCGCKALKRRRAAVAASAQHSGARLFAQLTHVGHGVAQTLAAAHLGKLEQNVLKEKENVSNFPSVIICNPFSCLKTDSGGRIRLLRTGRWATG